MPRLHIHVTGLPAPSFGEYKEVGLGIQVRKDLCEWNLVREGADRSFLVEFEMRDGVPRGPAIQKGIGGKFTYLVWTHGQSRQVFRRAKIMLDGIDLNQMNTVEVPALGRDGLPVCASLKGDQVRWSYLPSKEDQ